MSLQSAFPFVFNFLPQKAVVVEVSNEALSSDGGLIPIRQFERREGAWRERVIGLADGRLSLGVGGIVPGTLGQPRLVLAHAGERISSMGEQRQNARGGDTYIQIAGGDLVSLMRGEYLRIQTANGNVWGSKG